jgi:predicted RNase H-like nuclease (RuvC/YqgF family)
VPLTAASTNNPWIVELQRHQTALTAVQGENVTLKDFIQKLKTEAAISQAEFEAEEAKNKTFQRALRELSEQHSKLQTTSMARVQELESRIHHLEREHAAVTHSAAAHTEAIAYNRRAAQDQLTDMDNKVAILLEALSAVPDARSTCIDDAIDFIKQQQRRAVNADLHAKLLTICQALQVSPALSAHDLAVAAKDKLTEAMVNGLTQSGGPSASPLSRDRHAAEPSAVRQPAADAATSNVAADAHPSALIAGSVPFAYGVARPDDATGTGIPSSANPPTHR